MSWFRPISRFLVVFLVVAIPGAAFGQASPALRSDFAPGEPASPELALTPPIASLSPDVALATYERRLKEQTGALAAYTATSVIDAELPDSAQHAEFELKRRYVAPGSLEFTPLRSSGDKFVKSNIIVRLLEAEVEHVRRREQAQTAINSTNYKFSYKGMTQVNGAAAHVFEVKPRQRRVDLFKGKIYVDAASGRLLRAEGRAVKSPSFFIKRIDFVEDYTDVDGFTLLTHIHSEAKTRLVGKAVVDITHRDYRTELARSSEPQPEVVTTTSGSN